MATKKATKKAAPKKTATKKKAGVQKFEVKKTPKHDGILYARVKSDNAKFLQAKAKTASVSLSTFMDQLTDKLRAGEAVRL